MLIAASIIFVVLTNNPLFCILGLIAIIINTAFYLIASQVVLVGLLYIVIYIGAICVLFLFVVMLLHMQSYRLVSVKPRSFFSFLSGYLMFLFGSYFFINGQTESFSFMANIYNEYFNVAHLQLVAIYFIERPFIVLILTILLFLAVLSPLVVASARTVFVRKQELYFAFSRTSKTITLLGAGFYFVFAVSVEPMFAPFPLEPLFEPVEPITEIPLTPLTPEQIVLFRERVALVQELLLPSQTKARLINYKANLREIYVIVYRLKFQPLLRPDLMVQNNILIFDPRKLPPQCTSILFPNMSLLDMAGTLKVASYKIPGGSSELYVGVTAHDTGPSVDLGIRTKAPTKTPAEIKAFVAVDQPSNRSEPRVGVGISLGW